MSENDMEKEPSADAVEETTEPASSAAPKRRWWWKILLGVLAVLLATVVAFAGFYVHKTNQAASNIQREDFGISVPRASQAPEVDGKRAINILLIGSDHRGAERGRSDSLMVLHIPADRENLYLMSIPRDTYAEIPGHKKQKINAAYSLGGVALATQTVENLLEIRIDHQAVIDFDGFVQLTEVLGGVEVNNPEASQQGQWVWPAGKVQVQGDEALAFVRQRKELELGDLARAQRQRLVVMALIRKMTRPEVLANPVTYGTLMDQISPLVIVDKDFSVDVMRDLVFDMSAHLDAKVRDFQIPLRAFDNYDGVGAVDLLDETGLKELKKAFGNNQVAQYWDKHKNDKLIIDSTRPGEK